MKIPRSIRTQALTLMEVLIIVGVLMLLLAFLLPNLNRRGRARASRYASIQCVNNLKQVGLAFRVWETDHDDKFPMQVSITNSGAMEFVGSPDTFRIFEVMSNELNTPKILICPEESGRGRIMANLFGSDIAAPSGLLNRFAGNTNLSYFVGVDATDLNPQSFLSGDHNLTNG